MKRRLSRLVVILALAWLAAATPAKAQGDYNGYVFCEGVCNPVINMFAALCVQAGGTVCALGSCNFVYGICSLGTCCGP